MIIFITFLILHFDLKVRDWVRFSVTINFQKNRSAEWVTNWQLQNT